MCRIAGIVFEHGNNDFGYWDGFNLTEEEENIIQEILLRHDTEGCSVRGSKEEILEDLFAIKKNRGVILYDT